MIDIKTKSDIACSFQTCSKTLVLKCKGELNQLGCRLIVAGGVSANEISGLLSKKWLVSKTLKFLLIQNIARQWSDDCFGQRIAS